MLAVRTEGLGKRYAIGENVAQYRLLSEAVIGAARWTSRLLTGRGNGAPAGPDHIWALRDVDLDIEQGEVLGVVGRNGAGKTTLLKVLSRITEPTEGRAVLRGRVGSLLEVGTGFHPELTGRENIQLNGAILGMPRREIRRKFDEIVAFAEVERFVDTPVKRYSSGMYLRLAFSVAAHLDPDILIVDEVLAVGDAAFQKKCLGKMRDVSSLGRTILFVSHNMATIQSLCERAVMLDGGRVVASGPTGEVVQHYLASLESGAAFDVRERRDRRGSGRMRLVSITLLDTDGVPREFVQSGDDTRVVLGYEAPTADSLSNVVVTVAVDTLHGERVALLQNEFVGSHFAKLPPRGVLTCTIERLPLRAGLYPLSVYATVNGVTADWIINAAILRVEPGDYYGTGHYPDVQDGKILLDHTWSAEAWPSEQ